MKTQLYCLVLGFFLIFNGMNAANAERNPGGNTPVNVAPAPVAFVIHIDNRNHFTGINQNYKLVITDEHGRQVAPPQRFRTGEWYYTFYEQGPVTGTRVAWMIREPYRPGTTSIRPCSKTGTFMGNTCYLFTITPYLDAVPAGTNLP